MQACPYCRVGRLKEVALTFFRPFGNKLLVAPYAPANKCIICRYVEYDAEFLDTINQMVAPRSEIEIHKSSMNKEVEFQYYSHQENIKAI